MRYTVEVRVVGGDLPSFMSRMRTWLDHQRFEPDGFRCSAGSPTSTFRLDFKVEAEAIAFAATFGGRILGSTAPVSGAIRRAAAIHDAAD